MITQAGIIRVGTVFRRNIARQIPHPHVVLTDPHHTSGRFIVVNWTSISPYTQQGAIACRLNVGDHEWISNPSFIHYGYALLWTIAEFDAEVPRHRISQEVLDPSVIERILVGMASSADDVPTGVTNHLRALVRELRSNRSALG
jgi:hypothetical protein